MGVIEKLNDPKDWMNVILCSRKRSGELRICLDPKPLNKFIKRSYYKTPTLQEISLKLAGAMLFTKFDAKHGHWAIHLDEESSLLTCFNTPFGKCKYLRYPFALEVFQDIFQQKNGPSSGRMQRSHWYIKWHLRKWQNNCRTWQESKEDN